MCVAGTCTTSTSTANPNQWIELLDGNARPTRPQKRTPNLSLRMPDGRLPMRLLNRSSPTPPLKKDCARLAASECFAGKERKTNHRGQTQSSVKEDYDDPFESL